MTTNRKTIRTEIYTLLQPLLVGTGLPCAAFYKYRPYQIAANPIAFINSAGTQERKAGVNYEDNYLLFVIRTAALYSDLVGWNEDDAEDALDDVEHIVRDFIRTYRTRNGYWAHLEIVETDADTADFQLDGKQYRSERILIRAMVNADV